MLLLSTWKETLETKFDGRVIQFKPYERKRMESKEQGNHVLFKLMPQGIVEIPDEYKFSEAKLKGEDLLGYYIKGLKARRRTLNGVVQNYRTMNKEREAAKLSASQPEDNIIQIVKDITFIDEELSELKADDYKMVEKYLSRSEEKNTEELIKKTDQRVDEQGRITGSDSMARANGTKKSKETAPKAKGKATASKR